MANTIPKPALTAGILALKGKARGRRIPNQMNKTEALFAERLEMQRHAGQVVWWGYESITLKLGPDVRYTPDFPVMLFDGTFEFNETKGTFYRDDAKAKFQIAAGMFPFVFRWWTLDKGLWHSRTPWPEDR